MIQNGCKWRGRADSEPTRSGFAVLNGRETVCVPVWGFFESEALTLGLMGSWRGPGAGERGKQWMCCVFLLFFSHQRGRTERSMMSADWLRAEQTMSGSSIFADLLQVSCLLCALVICVVWELNRQENSSMADLLKSITCLLPSVSYLMRSTSHLLGKTGHGGRMFHDPPLCQAVFSKCWSSTWCLSGIDNGCCSPTAHSLH